MSDRIERLMPGDEPVEPFNPGDELLIRTPEEEYSFVAEESEQYPDKLELVEVADSDEQNKARALWDKTKHVSHELYESARIGEEGKRWGKIVGGIAAAASAGTAVYVIIKRHSRGG